MALNNLPFIHTIKNSPAILRQRFQRDRAKSLSHGDPAFRVHYAGTQQVYSLEVDQASEAVRQLLGAEGPAKACKDHVLVVRPRYLEVKELASGRQLTKTYLHDIAYCTADRAHPSVFLYICKHRRQLQCRVFRCNRQEKAQAITVCLAKVFEAAFSQWHAALGEGALPPLSPGTPGPDQVQPVALDAGTSREEEAEGEPSLDSDEEVELRMHREFLHRAASFRAPQRLDTGFDNVEELTRDSLVRQLVGGEQDDEEPQIPPLQPS